jgi:hypothetical protein
VGVPAGMLVGVEVLNGVALAAGVSVGVFVDVDVDVGKLVFVGFGVKVLVEE